MAEILRNITPDNFINWYSANETTNLIDSLNPDKYGMARSMPIIVQGEEYAYYLNFDKIYPFDILDIYPVVLNCDLTPAFDLDIYNLLEFSNQLFLKFSSGATNIGVYRMAIKVQSTGEILFFSAPILFNKLLVNQSNLFIFGSNKDIGTFFYTQLEGNVQKVRLLLTKKSIEFDQEIKQYRNSTNSKLRNTNFYIDKIIKLSVTGIDESYSEAITHLILCSDFYINGIGVTIKSGLKLSSSEQNNLYKGELEVYDSGLRYSIDAFLDLDIIIENLDSNIVYSQII